MRLTVEDGVQWAAHRSAVFSRVSIADRLCPTILATVLVAHLYCGSTPPFHIIMLAIRLAEYAHEMGL